MYAKADIRFREVVKVKSFQSIHKLHRNTRTCFKLYTLIRF